jgi:hypothetical protein
MKHSLLLAAAFLPLSLHAQSPDTPAQVVERGPHHRVWQRVERQSLPDGRTIERVRSFTELGNGLHYLKDGQWVESKEVFELFQDGAIARQGPHQVILAPNLNSPAAMDVLAADGQRYQSVILGIGLFDSATGAAELIAETKDSIGLLVANNEVVYQDAFDGIAADVRYTYRKSGIEQDVIIRQGFTLPAQFNAETTRLEVWTEFSLAPIPQRTATVRSGMETERIEFGDLRIGVGRAFFLDPGSDGPAIPVSTHWMQLEGRTFLVEAVSFVEVTRELARLGAMGQAALRKPTGALAAKAGQTGRPFPKAKLAKQRRGGERIQTASVTMPRQGLLIDYDLQNNYGSLTLKSDTTYVINGTVIVTNLVIEGATVLKYCSNAVLELAFGGTIDVQTDPYRPAIFTATNDTSVGTFVTSGPPTGYYANPALRLHDASYNFQHVRFSHAREAFNFDDGEITLRHGQFTFCQKAFAIFAIVRVWAENNLFYSASNVVYGHNFDFHGRNITVDQCSTFAGDTQANGTVTLTNSLLVHLTNWGVSTFTTNLVVTTTTSPFQTVGDGSHYLTTSCGYRDIGTTNIPAPLLADLRKMTTYPPLTIESTAWYTNNLDLVPQAQRDTDAVDLGYHYVPLDFVIGGLRLTNATMTASNGVAIGTRNINGYGIAIMGAAALLSGGNPNNPNRIVRYNTVQEQATANWSTAPLQLVTTWLPSSVAPRISARFTHWSSMAGGGEHFYTYGGVDSGTHHFTDSEFHSGDILAYGPTINFTNCLFDRSGLNVLDDTASISPSVRHCTFRGGIHNFARANSGTWTFRDNLFDDVYIPVQEAVLTHDFNAYTTNAVATNTARLTNAALNDIVLSVSNITYRLGGLGRFYLPTNLTSHNPLRNTTGTVGSYAGGSTNAHYLGLYHYTCITNQVKETNSVVDMGYHYVTTDSNGLPLDADADGWGDYWEDANGSGSLDSGETKTNDAADWGLKVLITRPKNGSQIP